MKAPRCLCTVACSLWVISLFLTACVPRAETLRQSCDGGNVHDCVNLGEMYAAGRELAKDEVSAATLYKQACDGGEIRGCQNLGKCYAAGTGVPKDKPHAAELFRLSCVRGAGASCKELGEMYVTGTGVPKDDARATAFFKRACDSTVILRSNGNSQHWERMDDEASSQCVAESMDRARSSSPSRPQPQ